ncbi:MAG: DUF4325 domain-containing protein [Burkholderiales bacterium]|nr:MAG: DUF4325 domain-containing protein [Burkholderiales bacterium]
MEIKVLDHVRQTSTYSDGQVIHDLLLPLLKQGQDVSLSFAGVNALPSAFVNSALVQLVQHLPITDIKEHLQIHDSTRQINQLIKERFAFVEEKMH